MLDTTRTDLPLTIVVDDEPIILALLAEGLELEGHRVAAFDHADAAWAYLASLDVPLRLLVSDLRMPGVLSGSDLPAKTHGRFPKARIVLTTGYLEEFDAPHPQYLIFLKKPWTLDQLLTACS